MSVRVMKTASSLRLLLIYNFEKLPVLSQLSYGASAVYMLEHTKDCSLHVDESTKCECPLQASDCRPYE